MKADMAQAETGIARAPLLTPELTHGAPQFIMQDIHWHRADSMGDFTFDCFPPAPKPEIPS